MILNPGARTGDDEEVLERLEPLLAGWEVRRTERAGHARELARAAAGEGFDTVIAAGGDGTVNEVVNGLAAAAIAGEGRAGLGVLPLGTGNDLVRLLDVPADPEEAVAALRRGASRRLDVAEMRTRSETRFFLNVAAGGFSGEVDRALTPEIKSTWGPLAYLRAAAEAVRQLDAYRVRIRFEGGETAGETAGDAAGETVELAALNVVVANGRFAGGGLPVAPRAHPADGLLEVVVIPDMPLPAMFALAPRILAGRHLDLDEMKQEEDGAPRVLYRRCRAVEIESDPPMPWNTDGELVGACSPAFRVIPGALSVLVGEQPLWELTDQEESDQAEPVSPR